MRGHLVFVRFSLFTRPKEIIEDVWKDGFTAMESHTARRADVIVIFRSRRDVSQRIDIEGTHQAGIQTLIIKNPNVFVHAGDGLQDVAPALRR